MWDDTRPLTSIFALLPSSFTCFRRRLWRLATNASGSVLQKDNRNINTRSFRRRKTPVMVHTPQERLDLV